MPSRAVTGVVGRDVELSRIETFLSTEPPTALIVAGQPGIGKTTLWQAGVVLARQAGQRVVVARPVEAESAIAFAALSDLLAGTLDDLLPGLPDPQRRALEVALRLTEPPLTPPDPLAIGRAIFTALSTLAERERLLIAIDDVQWLDPPSAAALAFAIRRIADQPIAILLARRTPGEPEAPLGLDRWTRPHEVIELGPLSVGALQRIMADRGLRFPRPVIRRLHELCGGNPLFGIELASAVGHLGRPISTGEPLPVPASLERLVQKRLSPLPAPTRRRLLELAAGGTTASGGMRDLAPALEAGIVEIAEGRPRFSHPLLATAVYRAAEDSQRRAAHRRLIAGARSDEERARHQARSAQPPDEAVADLLERAAGGASARGAPATAAELLEDAMRFTPPGGQAALARRALAAVDAHNQAGDGEHARRLAQQTADRLKGAQRAQLLVWLADADLTLARGEEAVAASRGNPELLAKAWSALSEARLHVGDVRQALEAARSALEAARAAGAAEAVMRAQSHVGFLTAMRGDRKGLAILEEALGLEAPGEVMSLYHGPRTALAIVRIWHDDLDRARAELEALTAIAAEHGDDRHRAALLYHLVKVEWRAGRWERARHLSVEISELHETSGWDQRGTTSWPQALIAAGLGDLEAARRWAMDGLRSADSADDRLFHLYHRAILGFVELSAGNAQGACEHLEPLPELLEAIGIGDPGVFCTTADELEALIGVGRYEAAKARIAVAEERGHALKRPRELVAAWRARGLLLAARGKPEEGLPWLERALAEQARLPVPFERARTLLALGSVLRQSRRKREARHTLERATAGFRELGARAWEARVAVEAARIGGRRAEGGLTPTEGEVARLVASGLSSKEVAGRLFISPRTVEGHLSRIFEKLGVRGRSELAHRLSATGEIGDERGLRAGG